MIYLFVLLLLAAAPPAGAQLITCKENVMTTNRFCSSKSEISGDNFYFFATNDAGTEAHVLFRFRGLISSARPDGIIVKLDSGTPFKVQATATNSDVHCPYYNCRWSVGARAKFTQDQFAQMGAATTMLVSFTQDDYVSDPMVVNPKKISSWFQ